MSNFCKYCLRDYNDRHLEMNNIRHCKVYFRKKYGKNNDNFFNISDKNYFEQFLVNIFIVIACYFILLFGLYNYIFIFFEYVFNVQKKKYKKCFYIFIYFLTILFSILFSIFIILLFPYFPLFNEIFQ